MTKIPNPKHYDLEDRTARFAKDREQAKRQNVPTRRLVNELLREGLASLQ